jgi:hypothetical protein
MIGGISEEGVRWGGLFAVLRWNDEIEGLVLRGGEGIPGSCGVMIASIGETCPENGSLESATEGDCKGDCIVIWLLADASIIRGGRSGVVAKFSSISVLLQFALSISIGVDGTRSSRLSKMLLAGVGGICGSMACRAEFETDDDLLDAPLEAEASRCGSEVNVAALAPFLNRHFREKDGNLVSKRVVSPVKIGESAALLFLERGLVENSPSLKNPSVRS